MASRTLTALFDRYEEATSAVTKLEAAGVPHRDISLVANNADDRHGSHASHGDAPAKAADGAGTGATLGTVLGGGAGLLAGLGLLAIPGIGPVVAAGWLISAAAGAGVGAAAGGLAGSLTGAGLSEDAAHGYAEGVRRGGTLITVRVDDATAARAQAILDEHGSVDVDERATTWRSEGWSGRGPDARDEVGSTGIGAATTTATGLGGVPPIGADADIRGVAGASRESAIEADERAARPRDYAGLDKQAR